METGMRKRINPGGDASRAEFAVAVSDASLVQNCHIASPLDNGGNSREGGMATLRPRECSRASQEVHLIVTITSRG